MQELKGIYILERSDVDGVIDCTIFNHIILTISTAKLVRWLHLHTTVNPSSSMLSSSITVRVHPSVRHPPASSLDI